jgi:hypothetical protein
MAIRLLMIVCLVLVGFPAHAKSQRWQRLGSAARQGIQLRRAVREMARNGQLRVAHPEVAARLSAELSQKLGCRVSIPARRIIQVEYESPAHHRLKGLLGQSIGIGIYPSSRWGHNKLRVTGDLTTDSVPRKARPFPGTGTRARLVTLSTMHRRFYDAVFFGEPALIKGAQQTASRLAAEKSETGMGCASYVSKIVREHIRDYEKHAGQGKAYGGKLSSLMRSESAAGPLWRKAAASSPAMIIVYTPKGDYRSVANPGFRFDYVLKPGE